jgi:tRNA (guanine37-N1)-methyltransferase
MVLKAEPLAEAMESLGIGPKADRATGPKTPRETKIPVRIGEEETSGNKARDDSDAQLARLKSCPDTSESSSPGFPAPADGMLGERRTRVVLLSAQGRRFMQATARELAGLDRVVLICGRYEGVDERINTLYCDMELSIGDYVLSGGELAAAVVIDAAMRLIPGVLGNEASGEFESFGVADAAIATDMEGVPRSQHGAGGLLDYPHYTRPAEFGGLRAPEVLLSGDHLQIRRWRREQQLRKTLANRPDLLEHAELSADDRKLLESIAQVER